MGKPTWPVFGPLSPDILEHGTLLLLHTNNILSRFQNKENPPTGTTEMLLKDIIAYLEKVREEPRQKEILEKVQKMSFNATQHQQRMEENFIIVKSSISNIFSAQVQTSKPPDATGVKTYASLFHHLHSPNLVPSNPLCPTINKDQEIVVRINNSEQKAILKDVSMDVILKNLNTCIDKMGGYCALRVIKRLPSGDFAVLTINNKEGEKLWSNTQWAGVLGSNARVVTRTYGIMINGVRVVDFDMTNKD